MQVMGSPGKVKKVKGSNDSSVTEEVGDTSQGGILDNDVDPQCREVNYVNDKKNVRTLITVFLGVNRLQYQIIDFYLTFYIKENI